MITGWCSPAAVVDENGRRSLKHGTQITTTEGKTRPVTPGDFLILVQSRKEQFTRFIRACKRQGLPVAGADRLRIGGRVGCAHLMAGFCALLRRPMDESVTGGPRAALAPGATGLRRSCRSGP